MSKYARLALGRAALRRIVSGGQTGVDRAALRAAAALGIETGGWAPPGWVAEDGRVPAEYGLRPVPFGESPLASDVPRSLRTEWNVRDSDGTLVVLPAGLVDPGTEAARTFAAHYRRPCRTVDPVDSRAAEAIRGFLHDPSIVCLNVAGPAERSAPGIGDRAFDLLFRALGGLVESDK